MTELVTAAKVYLWGQQIGAVTWNESTQVATFAYTRNFLGEIQPSPIHMKVPKNTLQQFTFRNLSKETYSGLPGMLADSLPDKFGNALIDVWLAKSGRGTGSMNPVEKLLYMGNRSMGALEFRPALKRASSKAVDVSIQNLISLTNDIIHQKAKLDVHACDQEALASILQIGTSAGGARPKGIVAIHEKTGHIISGQAKVPKYYEHWIIKFDGVSDVELGEPQGYGRIEYAYYLMARDAGIDMTECKLWEEGGRAHFMTRRFDRKRNEKIHMQSLCGIAHYDFNMPGAYSYEQALLVAQQIGLSKLELTQLFRRMVFNIIARNQDDHTKNIAFLMEQTGQWKLSPAFDVTYSHNPAGVWTNSHQMSVNGKRDDFTASDIAAAGDAFSINSKPIINDVMDAAKNWPQYAKRAGVSGTRIKEIAQYHRTF